MSRCLKQLCVVYMRKTRSDRTFESSVKVISIGNRTKMGTDHCNFEYAYINTYTHKYNLAIYSSQWSSHLFIGSINMCMYKGDSVNGSQMEVKRL
jgi:hypothetical protein